MLPPAAPLRRGGVLRSGRGAFLPGGITIAFSSLFCTIQQYLYDVAGGNMFAISCMHYSREYVQKSVKKPIHSTMLPHGRNFSHRPQPSLFKQGNVRHNYIVHHFKARARRACCARATCDVPLFSTAISILGMSCLSRMLPATVKHTKRARTANNFVGACSRRVPEDFSHRPGSATRRKSARRGAT